VITIEVDPGRSAAAETLGWPSWVRFVAGDAIEVLPSMGVFDLIFADGEGGKWYGLELTIDALAPGGLLVLDDLNAPPAKIGQERIEHLQKMRAVSSQISNDSQLVAVKLDYATGLLLAARYRAIAHQHEAAFVQLSDGRPFGYVQRFGERLLGHEELNASRVELRPEVLTGLADMPADEWAASVSKNIRHLYLRWSHGQRSALQRAMENLSQAIASERSSETLFGIVVPHSVTSAMAGAEAGFFAAESGLSAPAAALVGAATTALTAVVQATAQPKRRIQRRSVEIALAATP
jgi:hypothetical protein